MAEDKARAAIARILLVESDPEEARRIQEMLAEEAEGVAFDLACADRLSKGVERLAQGGIDLILLDLSLSDSQGLATFNRMYIKAPEAPIVVLGSVYEKGVGITTLREGAYDYLVKEQMDRNLLRRSVSYTLERRRLRADLERYIRELQLSQERLQTIIEKNVDGAMVVDKPGIARFANPAAGVLFGCQAEELVGEWFGFPITISEPTELSIRRRGGEIRVAEMHVAEIDWEGESACLVMLRDITEHKRAEEMQAEVRAKTDRIKELEQELRLLEHLARPLKTPVTAGLYGAAAMYESLPDVFNELVQSYGDLMDLRLEEQAYKVKSNSPEKFNAIVQRLGFLKAGPRDVVDIHTSALKSKTRKANPEKVQAYIAEGRLMVLEVMGYLASYYRNYAFGARGAEAKNSA